MSNKSQLQENNGTLQFVLEQIQDKPTTEQCMEAIEDLEERVTPIEKGGTGATTSQQALENLGAREFIAGSYVGTEEARTINIGGKGQVLLVTTNGAMYFVTCGGVIGRSDGMSNILNDDSSECSFNNGVLTIYDGYTRLNHMGTTYNYQVL